LVTDERDAQVLAVRQVELAGRCGTEPRDEPVEDARQAIDRDLEGGIPGDEPLPERSVPGQELVDRGRRRVETLVWDP
jgi:hypothetical protein